MKKFFLLTVISVALFSCKKDKTNDPDPVNNQDPALEAYFKFSSDYNDETGKTTGFGGSAASFTTDRKGQANAAAQVDGTGGIQIKNVFLKGKAFSVATWIAKDVMTFNFLNPIIDGSGMSISQEDENMNGSVSVPATSSVGIACPDLGWHHYALTYDGLDIKFYKDGVLAGVKNHPGGYNDGPKNFTVGYGSNTYWKGRVDDLRFYSKILSADEVMKLSKE